MLFDNPVQTTAYFERIPQTIIAQLQQARQSVVIAVAWFTDSFIFRELSALAGRGVSVELMIANDEANFRETGLDFEQLRRIGGRVHKAGKQKSKVFMHNKFCVIDGQTVITGSFNWSQSARQNHENIVVSTEADELAGQFLIEFRQLLDRYAPPGPTAVPDLGKVLKRLDLIKTLIALDETESIAPHIHKLNEFSLPTDLTDIVQLLRRNQFAEAVRHIEQFSKSHATLAPYIDAEIGALKVEIRILELQIKALDAERADIEKMLHEFSVQHTLQLGDLIIRILQLRKEQAGTQPERDEAKADYDQYQQEYTETRQQPHHELTVEEQAELKKRYRKAAQLCHPDVVAEQLKGYAEELFKELKSASDSNDLVRVTEILESGKPLPSRTETVTEKTLLQHERIRLQQLADTFRKTLEMIRESKTFQQISQIANWNTYFAETRTKLQAQLETLSV